MEVRGLYVEPVRGRASMSRLQRVSELRRFHPSDGRGGPTFRCIQAFPTTNRLGTRTWIPEPDGQ